MASVSKTINGSNSVVIANCAINLCATGIFEDVSFGQLKVFNTSLSRSVVLLEYDNPWCAAPLTSLNGFGCTFVATVGPGQSYIYSYSYGKYLKVLDSSQSCGAVVLSPPTFNIFFYSCGCDSSEQPSNGSSATCYSKVPAIPANVEIVCYSGINREALEIVS